MARLRFDRSPASVVVVCACGWRDVAATRDAADHAAAAHLGGAHAYTPRDRDANYRRVVRAARKRPA